MLLTAVCVSCDLYRYNIELDFRCFQLVTHKISYIELG